MTLVSSDLRERSVSVDMGLTARLYSSLHQICFLIMIMIVTLLSDDDTSPDLLTGLTRQPVTTEQPTQLGDPLTGLAPHLPHPGGQVSVGSDVARALTMWSGDDDDMTWSPQYWPPGPSGHQAPGPRPSARLSAPHCPNHFGRR